MGEQPSLHLRFDTFELNEADARLTCDGTPISLPPKAFSVLCTLLHSEGRLVTKSALLDSVWGHQYVSESVLKTTISELRTALGDDARSPRLIETAARRGCRFIGGAVPAPERVSPVVIGCGRNRDLRGFTAVMSSVAAMRSTSWRMRAPTPIRGNSKSLPSPAKRASGKQP